MAWELKVELYYETSGHACQAISGLMPHYVEVE